MRQKLVFIVAVILLVLIFVSVSFAQKRQLIRVVFRDKVEAENFFKRDLDFATRYSKKYADIVVTEKEKNLLQQQGFDIKVLEKDLLAKYNRNVAATKDMGDYHSYQEMYDEMVQINNNHPAITNLSSIGQSIQGREIWAMKVSDNPTQEEADEPDLLYMANMHAREVITPEIMLYFLNYLVDNYGTNPEITDLVNNREFWIIPTQNPDGHVYCETVDPMWRKNRRNNGDGTYGVDLNRNYGYMWGYDDYGSNPNTSSSTYRGTGPFSEPESQVIRDLCISHNFVFCLSYHSYSNLWLFPWSYVAQNTPHHEIFMELANNCVAYNGYIPGNYAMGTIYRVNGDVDDYMYGEQTEKNMIFGFTPEVGNEFWPPENEIQTLCEENLEPNLYMARIAHLLADNPYRIFGPAVPILDPMDVDVDGNYTISWTITDDPNNLAVAYHLEEFSGYSVLTDEANDGENYWDFNGFSTSTARSHTSPAAYYSNSGDNLNNSMTSFFPLVVESGNVLTFWTWYDIENDWDYAYVEVSTDGGQTFNTIPGNITTNYDPHGNNLGNGITGSSGGWVEANFDLSSYAGQSINSRFRYVTDGSVDEEGIYIDDIYPVPSFDSQVSLDENITGTSYLVQNQSTGTYFYRVRAKDADEQWGGWSDLEDIYVDYDPNCLLGDVNNDGAITPEDALCAFLRYLMGVFPPGGECDNECAEYAADVNCTPNGITPQDALNIFLGYMTGAEAPLDCVPGATSGNVEMAEDLNLSFQQIDSEQENELAFVIKINKPFGLKTFGLEVSYPTDLLEFKNVVAADLTELWQEFGGLENESGLIRIGGFNDEAVQLEVQGNLAKITFNIKTGAEGTGELRLSNLCDNIVDASVEPITVDIFATGVRRIEGQWTITKYVLEQNFPNPFNMETEIRYQIPEADFVEIAIYNSVGQKIKTLVSQNQTAGRYEVRWDGKDESGNVMASGVYVYKLVTQQFSNSKKLTLIK